MAGRVFDTQTRFWMPEMSADPENRKQCAATLRHTPASTGFVEIFQQASTGAVFALGRLVTLKI